MAIFKRSRQIGDAAGAQGVTPGVSLLRLLDSRDWTVMIISGIAAIVSGAIMPLVTVVVGNVAQSTRSYFVGNADASTLSSQTAQLCLYYVYLTVAQFVSVYISTVGFVTGGERITQKLRERYLNAVLRQEIGFFDNLGSGEIAQRILDDINQLQDGLTGKLSLSLTSISTFATAFVVILVEGWKLGLIMLSGIVAITGTMVVGGWFMVRYAKTTAAANGLASSAAQESLEEIKQVTAMGMQEALLKRYNELVLLASRSSIRGRIALAVMIAVMNACIAWSNGLAFWEGSRLLANGEESLGALVTTLLSVSTGAFALGNIAPHIQAFGASIGASAQIFTVIERQSQSDASSTLGKKLPQVKGRIYFRDVSFRYPSRKDTQVLDSLDLVIEPGQTTAIVGPSGSGKSTLVELIERFYKPSSGTIELDDVDTSELNVKWLRQNIAMVGQEPFLFDRTIQENISYGLDEELRKSLDPSEIERRVIKAAGEANALDFIDQLPDGPLTKVGERGRLLSGGQRQRIAIARAIIKEPRILLLDEVTSALDVKSEEEVQKGINTASAGRTTIIIAHRLSTIKSADKIVVVEQGHIVESGTHEELVRLNGLYASMVEKQQLHGNDAENMQEFDNNTEVVSLGPDEDIAFSAKEKTDIETVETPIPPQHSPKVKSESIFSLLKFVASLNRPELLQMSAGLLFSVLAGCLITLLGLFYAMSIQTLTTDASRSNSFDSQISFLGWMWLMLGFLTLIFWLIQGLCFANSTEKLVIRAKSRLLRSMLAQDVAFFESGAMTAGKSAGLLSASVNGLAGMSAVTLGTMLSGIAIIVSGFVVSVAIAWKMALVCSITIPIILASGWAHLRILAILEKQSKAAYQVSATYASEASSSMRTVASLGLEEHIASEHHKILERQRRVSAISTLKSSALFGLSQSLKYPCAALAFWWGGRLIVTDNYSMFQYFLCYSGIIAGAFAAGAVFSFAPDVSHARESASDIKEMLEREPQISMRDGVGDAVESCEGAVTLRSTSFAYPSRPDRAVLKNIDLHIRAGEYVAICGASGSGKSTIISLLERFHDPSSGAVLVDGRDIRELNVGNLRKQFSLVSQESALFSGTIRSNIELGCSWRTVSDEEIKKACTQANILDFVQSLPEGLDTNIGSRGVMLSGGQRQRISIARALIRDPKILLLDEATSALDTESERVVQAAINEAAKNRTTISIAHRLSTIQSADRIIVMEDGEIVEQGSHAELVKLDGKYADMVRQQSLV
ncbi:P-loop containing nucleoside triphosphate hydrolase protein [Hypoxylon crocopeplum]|nr:P-loop containing nucleoside triphosphate hydrolase protein [Hypoxylon crocopeplum]